MEDEYKIYCKFNNNEQPLNDVMGKIFIEYLDKKQKILQNSRHINKEHDKI